MDHSFWPTHQLWCLKWYDNLAIKITSHALLPSKFHCVCVCVLERERQRVNMSSRGQLPGNDNNPGPSEEEKLIKINEKQENRIHALEAKALQLTNLYFVFQGVILSTSASARSIKCHHWWIPFVLSLLAAILNLFAFYFTIKKILRCRKHFDQNLVDIDLLRSNKGVTIADVAQVQPGEQLTREVELRRNRPDQCKQWWRGVLAYASVGLSLGFSGVVLYGCHALLCGKTKEEQWLINVKYTEFGEKQKNVLRSLYGTPFRQLLSIFLNNVAVFTFLFNCNKGFLLKLCSKGYAWLLQSGIEIYH